MNAAKARRVDVGRARAVLLTGTDAEYAYVSTTSLLSDAPMLHTPPAGSAWPPPCAQGKRVILVRRAAVNGFPCPTCSGSASAAADEPPRPFHEYLDAQDLAVMDAAADEPGETP